MKKRILGLLAALLMTLTGCDSEAGITIVNNLGMDLAYLEILNGEGIGTTWGDGLPKGASDLAYVHQGAEGTVSIRATDVYGNMYELPAVYVHDGTELSLEIESTILYARHYYADELWEETGMYSSGFTPVEPDEPVVSIAEDEPVEPDAPVVNNAHDELAGDWLYSDGDYSISLDYSDGFVWDGPEGMIYGAYSYDGDSNIELYYDDIVCYVTYHREEGRLTFEGDAGSWYSRQN